MRASTISIPAVARRSLSWCSSYPRSSLSHWFSSPLPQCNSSGIRFVIIMKAYNPATDLSSITLHTHKNLQAFIRPATVAAHLSVPLLSAIVCASISNMALYVSFSLNKHQTYQNRGLPILSFWWRICQVYGHAKMVFLIHKGINKTGSIKGTLIFPENTIARLRSVPAKNIRNHQNSCRKEKDQKKEQTMLWKKDKAHHNQQRQRSPN